MHVNLHVAVRCRPSVPVRHRHVEGLPRAIDRARRRRTSRRHAAHAEVLRGTRTRIADPQRRPLPPVRRGRPEALRAHSAFALARFLAAQHHRNAEAAARTGRRRSSFFDGIAAADSRRDRPAGRSARRPHRSGAPRTEGSTGAARRVGPPTSTNWSDASPAKTPTNCSNSVVTRRPKRPARVTNPPLRPANTRATRAPVHRPNRHEARVVPRRVVRRRQAARGFFSRGCSRSSPVSTISTTRPSRFSPAISRGGVNASPDELVWASSAYAVAAVLGILQQEWWVERFGYRRYVAGCMLLYSTSAAAAALSDPSCTCMHCAKKSSRSALCCTCSITT
jgi:hypothetical protein